MWLLVAGKPRRRMGRRRHAGRRTQETMRAALEVAMSLYSLSSVKLFQEPVQDTKALLAWNRDTAVLAFRGTASLTNACSDLQVALPHPAVPGWPRALQPESAPAIAAGLLIC